MFTIETGETGRHVVEIVATPSTYYFLFNIKEGGIYLDLQALEFMSKEMLTTDVDTQNHIEEMFVEQAQAGVGVATEGANLRRLQQRYNMVPHKINKNGYPDKDISETNKRLSEIKE